jgi:hypothetical protein
MKRREEASVSNLNVEMSQLFHRTSGVAARRNTNQFRVVRQFDWCQEIAPISEYTRALVV